MQKMSLSFDDLKEKGNNSIRQKNYRDAARYYTAALEINPRSHVGYSNRSLAYSKLGRYQDALSDANRCTELDPGFARGHLQRSVALTHLDKTEEAMRAAEEGYRLRGSATICRDCVTQWLEANGLFHKEMVDKCLGESGPPEMVIPKGCRVISEDYMTVLLNTILCRMQPTTMGVKVEYMLAWILTLLEELKRILQLFGHTLSTCAREWVEALSLVSWVDPSTSRVPADAVELVLARASAFATWFDSSVDHNLYPIAQPIVSLIVVAVSVRCISLNLINIEQPVTVISCRACLPFFEKAPLTVAVYIQQRLCLYKELLEAFTATTYELNDDERQFGKKAITSTQSLIQQFPVDDFLTNICEKTIAFAQLRLYSTPGLDPVQYVLECGKAFNQTRKKTPENLKSHALQKMNALKSVDIPHFDVLEEIPLDISEAQVMASYEDMVDLALCAGALVGIGEHILATEALQLSEMSFLKYFHLHIARGAFGLDEAGKIFATPRVAILQGSTSFLGSNDCLVADSIIRWKCISSEFRAVIIRLGIGKRYIKTFQAIQTAVVEGKLNPSTVMTITSQHEAEAQQFMEEKGKSVLSCLFHQSVREIESILQPGQLILEYCVFQAAMGDEKSAHDHYNCLLVALEAKSEVIVFTIDFKHIVLMVQKWVQALSDPEAQKEARSLAESVCKLLIPPPVEDLLSVTPKKQLFLCPDVPLNVLPLELLLFKDGKTLGEKCTITYLSSSRELLRNKVIERVLLHELDSVSHNPSPTDKPVSTESADPSTDTNNPSVSANATDSAVPANTTDPATATITANTTDPATATIPATPTIPANTTDPATATIPANTTDPATATLRTDTTVPVCTIVPTDTADPTSASVPAETIDLANASVTANTTDPGNVTVTADTTGPPNADTTDPANVTVPPDPAIVTDPTSASIPTTITDPSTSADSPKECVIVAAPNFNLEKPATTDKIETGLWGAVIKGIVSLFSNEPAESGNVVTPLLGTEREAIEVESILSKLAGNLKVRQLKGDNATLLAVLSLQSPLILHFSTHGFFNQDPQTCRCSFWNDTKCGLLLAGANTYHQGKLEQVAIEAGTGELTAMAACGMSLEGTRLVYLSTCDSSFGIYSLNESLNSLAEAFRSAGAQTVVATLWPVYDDTAQPFSAYFYEALCTTGTTPSQALALAKKKLRENTAYKHWKYWSSFICIGEDNPLFPRV